MPVLTKATEKDSAGAVASAEAAEAEGGAARERRQRRAFRRLQPRQQWLKRGALAAPRHLECVDLVT